MLANSLGAMCLGNTVAFKTVKTWLPFKRAHIEPMRGSPLDSKRYCSKEDPAPFEFGTCPTKGNNLLEIAVAAVRAGSSLRKLANEDDIKARAVVVHGRGLSTLSNLTTPSRDPGRPPAIYWFHGSTGTGKTRCAFELGRLYVGGNDDDLCIIASPTLQWFEPYDKQRVAIFDDFRAKGVSFNFLLRVLDRYPLLVPIKGGYTSWIPEVIFITTPRAPSDTFEVRSQHKPEDVQQLLRRLKLVVNFDEPEEVVEFRKQFELDIPKPAVQATEDVDRLDEENGQVQDTGGCSDGSRGRVVRGGTDDTRGRVGVDGGVDERRDRERRDMVESARIIASLCGESSSDSLDGERANGLGEDETQSDLELLGTPEESLDDEVQQTPDEFF